MPSRQPENQWGATSRARRLSSDEARAQVLDVAVSMLQTTGLTLSLEHLNLEELIRAAEVPRSSFYRIWPSKENFYADLLVKLARPFAETGAAFDPETLRLAERVFRRNAHRLFSRAGRRKVVEEAVRVGARQNFEAISESVAWRTYIALIVTTTSLNDEETRMRLLGALREAEVHFLKRMADFYNRMLTVAQVNLNPGVSLELVAGVGAAVVEGMAQREITNPDIANQIVLRPGMDGELVEWHPAALGFWGVLQVLVDWDDESKLR